MTQAIKKNISYMLMFRERIFWTLAALSILCLCSYGFLLEKTIVNVVARGDATASLRTVSSSVSDLESQYFSIQNSITESLAQEHGLNKPVVINYVKTVEHTAFATPLSNFETNSDANSGQ